MLSLSRTNYPFYHMVKAHSRLDIFNKAVKDFKEDLQEMVIPQIKEHRLAIPPGFC